MAKLIKLVGTQRAAILDELCDRARGAIEDGCAGAGRCTGPDEPMWDAQPVEVLCDLAPC